MRPKPSLSGSERAGHILLCFVAIVAGSVLSYFFCIRPVLLSVAAKDWVQVPCRVLSSKVEEHPGGDSGTTYKIAISYSYQVDGKKWRSDRYQFTIGSETHSGEIRDIVRRYPPGKMAVCYINPQEPSDAVMDRGIPDDIWLGLIPLIFVLIGLGSLVSLLFGGGRLRKTVASSPVS